MNRCDRHDLRNRARGACHERLDRRRAVRARAFAELGVEQGNLDAVVEQVSTLAAAWKESAELRNAIENPLVAHEAKKAVILALIDRISANTTTRSAVLLLVDRRRAKGTAVRGADALTPSELADARKGSPPRRGDDRGSVVRGVLWAAPSAARGDDGQTRRRRPAHRPFSHRRRRIYTHRRSHSGWELADAPAVAPRRAHAPEPLISFFFRPDRAHTRKRRCSFVPKRFPRSSSPRFRTTTRPRFTTETGTVLSVGDGIARIYGLEGAMAAGARGVPRKPDGPRSQPRGGQRRRGLFR